MKAHFIGIGGIGISAVARYYQAIGYSITGSDSADSTLIHTLQSEGMDIIIGTDPAHMPDDVDIVVYTEAIITKPDLTKEENLIANPELAKARNLGLKNLSYPEALAEIVNAKKCIAVAGSHGKSTTTAMLGIMLAGSSVGGSTIVGTQVPGLGNSNFYYEDSPYFAIEACEYKRSFLKYFPTISIITNIDLDHLDYYRDLEDYISAFMSFQSQTSDYIILNGHCKNSQKLRHQNLFFPGKKIGIRTPKQIWVYDTHYINEHGQRVDFGEFHLQVPGAHIEFDAKMVYVTGQLIGLSHDSIMAKLESYMGCWRRSEIIKTTINGAMLMSDYGHHPSEIDPTLKAIKGKYPDKKLIVIFQPHQYSRTRELLDQFATCFDAADELIIPNIYFSRDKQEDVEYMTTERLIDTLKNRYPQVINGNGLENTLTLIKNADKKYGADAIIILQGAGNIDELRYKVS